MCGIAGILSRSPAGRIAAEELRPMAAALVHRGPDDEGFYVDPQGRCGLAFRRLSIIDLAGGHQPIANEDGAVWLVFNGEIYNFRELRGELESHGHRFRTRCDSEVIVHAYEQWGGDCFARLHGMFAIAIWDERGGRLTLARDRVGKKPLCYWPLGDRVYFASEVKAILALPGVPREIDPQALHEYLVFQYVPAPRGVYRGLAKLPPGHVVTLSADGATDPQPAPYWRIPTPDAPAASCVDERETLARLDGILRRSVERRLVADVPLGAFLSGGLDSSVVVGLMRRLGVSPLRTFSIGFAESAYDESSYARLVARRFDTEHHEHVVTPRATELLDTLAYHYDEPFGDSSAIPTFAVAGFTRQSVTVALTGDGGDECFGGYDRYRALRATAWADRAPMPLRRAIASLAQRLPRGPSRSRRHRAVRLLTALPASPVGRYLSWVCVFSPEMLAEAYRPEFAERVDLAGPFRLLAGWMAGPGSAAARANRADIAAYLPFDLLTKVDIASMACSLECRCPLLDHELIEFALGLPDGLRFSGGGKRILRRWARELLPREVLSRSKMGFGVPIGPWFRTDLRTELRDALVAPDSLSSRIFRAAWLDRLVQEHCAGRENHDHRLWALFMLERWRRAWAPRLD